jgi:hypothetical protein
MFPLGSRHGVFMDRRVDLYESGGVFQDFLAAIGTREGLWDLLRKYKIHSYLVYQGSMQAALLRTSPQWRELQRSF